MVANIGRTVPLAFALLALTIPASDARAQGNTFNPFGNSGYADYREFGSPMISNNPSLPGQARLNAEPIITRPRANSFQQYADSLEGLDPVTGSSASRRSSAGLPYYQAYRQYDKEFNRVYRPNVNADKGFDEHLRKRDQAYLKAMDEKDPVKRGKLLRQLDQDSLDRTTTTRTRPSPLNPSRAGATSAPATRAPSPNVRRTPSPSPTPRPSAATPGGQPRAAATAVPEPPAPRSEPRSLVAPDPSTIAIPAPR